MNCAIVDGLAVDCAGNSKYGQTLVDDVSKVKKTSTNAEQS